MCVSRLPPSRTLPRARVVSSPRSRPRLSTNPPPPPPRARRSYNRRQADFAALKEYNDYLETVEDIIFNLCGNDVRATERAWIPPRERRRDRAPEPAKRRGGARLRAAAPVAMDPRQDPTSDAWAPGACPDLRPRGHPRRDADGGGAGGDPPAPGSSAGPPPETGRPGVSWPDPPRPDGGPRAALRGEDAGGGTGGTRITRGGTTRRIPPRTREEGRRRRARARRRQRSRAKGVASEPEPLVRVDGFVMSSPSR